MPSFSNLLRVSWLSLRDSHVHSPYKVIENRAKALHRIVSQFTDEMAEGADIAREAGRSPANPKLLLHHSCVHRPGATISEYGKVTRIVTALYRYFPDATRHGCDGKAKQSFRQIFPAAGIFYLLGQLVERPFYTFGDEAHLAIQNTFWKPPEKKIGIRDRDFGATLCNRRWVLVRNRRCVAQPAGVRSRSIQAMLAAARSPRNGYRFAECLWACRRRRCW